MAKVKFKQISDNFFITVEFSDHYRQNRHRNKKAYITIKLVFGEFEKRTWKGLCRLRRNNEVSWEFPENFAQSFREVVESLYTNGEIIEEFQKLERRKKL